MGFVAAAIPTKGTVVGAGVFAYELYGLVEFVIPPAVSVSCGVGGDEG